MAFLIPTVYGIRSSRVTIGCVILKLQVSLKSKWILKLYDIVLTAYVWGFIMSIGCHIESPRVATRVYKGIGVILSARISFYMKVGILNRIILNETIILNL